MTDTRTYTKPDYVPIFKKWHKTGFISVSYWPEAQKAVVDIGKIDPADDNALRSSTKCFLPAVKFLAYLRAENQGTLFQLFPKYAEEGWSEFSGSETQRVVDGTSQVLTIARVFKSTYWTVPSTKQADTTARAFKCGHFHGTKTSQGAFTPQYDKPPISVDLVKLTMLDLSLIFEQLQLAMNAEAVAQLIAD